MYPELQRAESLAQEIEPVVRGIIRRKLRVTLDPGDGRRENQNGLELFGDVWVKLLQEQGGDGIHNVRSYTAVVTYHACSEYFRGKYPARSSLRNRAHYFLTHHPRYQVWEHEGDLAGGFAIWRDKRIDPAPAERLAGLDSAAAKPVERMKPADWDDLFDSIFETLGAPVVLDDLVNAIAPMVGSVDAVEGEKKTEEDGHRDVLPDIPSPDLSPERRLRIRLQLQRLWIEILQLRPRQRFAYLLNPTGGEVEVFPENGIAGIADIGRSLALSDEQFELIAKELALPLPGNYEQKFGRFVEPATAYRQTDCPVARWRPSAGYQLAESGAGTLRKADEKFPVI